MPCFIEFFPVRGVVDEMFESGLVVEALFEPAKITGHTEVILRAANDGHVAHGVPGPNAFAATVVGPQLLMHVLDEPVLDQPPQCFRIQQRKAERSQRRIPGKTEGGNPASTESDVSRSV